MAKSTLEAHSTLLKRPEKRKAMMRRSYPLQLMRKQNGGGIQNSHGASWVRGRFLGEGGFGLVFLAKSRNSVNDDSELPSEMAVKSAYLSQADSLKHEKEVICTLKASPFVVQCYGDEITETGDGKKIYNILLEYCSGCGLNDYIKKSKTGLPESEVQCYAKNILRGLQYVHCRGFVHCDIKPSNILLVPDSSSKGGGFVAKIADFGLAKMMYGDEGEALKERGMYRYMAPEVVRDNTLEFPADIWAFGCVVMEMMSGKQVWGDVKVDDDLLMLIAYSPEMPEFPSNISDHGRDFLEKCLVKCGDYRWSAESLLGHPFLLEGS